MYVNSWLLSFICVDLGFTVQVQLSPQQAIYQCANISVVGFAVLIASRGQLAGLVYIIILYPSLLLLHSSWSAVVA